MFKPAKMLHARLAIPRQKTQGLVRALHEAGLCQVKESRQPGLESFENLKSPELLETERRLSGLLSSLDKFKPVPQPENLVKGLLFPSPPKKTKVDLLSDQAVLKEVEQYLDVLEPKAQKQSSELKQAEQRIEEISFEKEELAILPDLPTETFSSTENISVLLGLVTAKGLSGLEKSLKKCVYLTKPRTKNTFLLAVACRHAERPGIEKELHSVGFEPLEVKLAGKTPNQIIQELDNERLLLERRASEIRLFLQNIAKNHWEKMNVLSEELGVCLDRANAFSEIAAGKSFCVLEAWLPEKNLPAFKQLVRKNAGSYYLSTGQGQEGPTLLKNPRILKPFEMITELYSVPKPNGLDPTPVVAITFALFFGYMLTDFVYGIALLLIAFVLFRGIGKYNPDLRRFSAVLIGLGISTAILGAIFTSYFGDFFPRVGIEMPGLLDPLKEVIVIIGLAVLIGVLHISIGLLMGFANNLRLGRKKDAFARQGVWIIFLIGIALAVFGFLTIGLGLIVLAAILNMVFKALEGGPIMGVLSLFDFTGFVGDVFSYARLTALAIGTAGIALAVNFMALMVIDMVPFVGLPLAIIIFIIGHSFNMIMNGLGAFIHSLRLHFLEFFQKFYDGGGKLYRPFYAKRETTIGGK